MYMYMNMKIMVRPAIPGQCCFKHVSSHLHMYLHEVYMQLHYNNRKCLDPCTVNLQCTLRYLVTSNEVQLHMVEDDIT